MTEETRLQRWILENGLTLLVYPVKGYHQHQVYLTVQAGAMDVLPDVPETPLGLAHFLEHTLFAGPNGEDESQLLTDQGAYSNASTHFTKTLYYFTGVDNLREQLSVFLKMTQDLHVTKASVEKEREIIRQEIAMYADDPDDRLYQEIYNSLYPQTPLAVDIAGTEETVAEIGPDTLEQFFDLYYQPSLMQLLIVGDVDGPTIKEMVEEFEKTRAVQKQNLPVRAPLRLAPIRESFYLETEVRTPKIGWGLRRLVLPNKWTLRQKLALRFFLDMLLGWTSSTYQEWLASSLIDGSFQVTLETEAAYHYVMVTTDSPDPEQVARSLKERLWGWRGSVDLTEEHLELIKREWLGGFMRQTQSLDTLAEELAHHVHYLETPDLIETLGLEEVVAVGDEFLASADWAKVIMTPISQ